MRLQVCGTSVKIPHISLAEMKRKKKGQYEDFTLPPWATDAQVEQHLRQDFKFISMWDKRKDIKCKLQMEKKLTGRVLVVKNTSTHCSNHNAALNISRLQLCGVSKKEKRSMLPSDGGLWELHPTYQNMTNGVFLNTSQVKCIYDLFFKSDSDISQWWPPRPLTLPHQEGHEGSTWTRTFRTFTNYPKHKTFADNLTRAGVSVQ